MDTWPQPKAWTPIEVKVVRTHPDAALPVRGSEYAAGWDIRAVERTIVEFKFNYGPYWIESCHSSGIRGTDTCKDHLLAEGAHPPTQHRTIDADYRGELFVLMTWIGEGSSYTIEKGERIVQMVIAPIPPSKFTEVNLGSLGDTERGEGGFGSTGRF